jgi:hypothetical protein
MFQLQLLRLGLGDLQLSLELLNDLGLLSNRLLECLILTFHVDHGVLLLEELFLKLFVLHHDLVGDVLLLLLLDLLFTHIQ